jgi:regulator of replication initiation timing
LNDLQKELEERDEKIAELEAKLAELIEENERLRGLSSRLKVL